MDKTFECVPANKAGIVREILGAFGFGENSLSECEEVGGKVAFRVESEEPDAEQRADKAEELIGLVFAQMGG